ncbi:MAG: hypothetical protein WD578_13380 [Bacteroidales bacterium]
MKFILITLITATTSINSIAQDKILKNDNTVVEGIVLKVDATNIEVNPVGSKPFLIVPRADAKLIIYDDNTVVLFEKENPYLEEMRLRMEAAAFMIKLGLDNMEGKERDSIFDEEEENIYDYKSSLGDGPSYGLGSRKAVGQLPRPDISNCNVTSRIVVTIEVQVDRSGNVISAAVKSATFADNCIWNVVMDTARKTKFTSDQNAAFRQTGWIKYTMEP